MLTYTLKKMRLFHTLVANLVFIVNSIGEYCKIVSLNLLRIYHFFKLFLVLLKSICLVLYVKIYLRKMKSHTILIVPFECNDIVTLGKN